MFNFIRVLGLAVLCVSIIACQQHLHKNGFVRADERLAQLQLVNIRTDNTDTQYIKQIIFEFNQNIAIVGELPSPEQISAIKMSHNLAALCLWRFVTLQVLSCELTQALTNFTHYHINVTPAFTAQGKSLSIKNSVDRAQFNIITTFPNNDITPLFSADEHYFPSQFSVYNADAESDFIEHMLNNLVLKSPSGAYLANWIQLKKTKNAKPYYEFVISPPKPPLNQDPREYLENGTYRIVLRRGFSPKDNKNWQYRHLTEELVLVEFSYHSDFVFYGIQCMLSEDKGSKAFDASSMQLHTNDFDCPPESIVMGFSRPLAVNRDDNRIITDTWISGPEFEINATNANAPNNIFYYNLQLQGESLYTFDLTKVRSSQNESVKEPNTLMLTTQPSSPLWYLTDQNFVSVEASTKSDGVATRLPRIMRRNVDDLQQTMKTIDSANALLRYINNKQEQHLPTITKSFLGNANTRTWAHEQDIQFDEMLNRESGLVAIELIGTSQAPKYYRNTPDPSLEIEQAELVVNAAAFNLLIWQSNELLIQAIDWDANSLSNISVYAVCEGFEQVLFLGRTDNDGLLHVKHIPWLTKAMSGTSQDCWLWAQDQAMSPPPVADNLRSAAIQLGASPRYRYPDMATSRNDSLSHIEAYSWTTQPIHKPGDQVNIGFFGREQGPSGLQSLTAFSESRFTLNNKNGDELRSIDFANLSPMGFARTQFDLPIDAAVGTYTVIMAHPNSSSKIIGYLLVEEFVPPEFEQILTGPEYAYKNDKVELNIRANRLNGAALINAKATLLQTYSQLDENPEDWPSAYEFSSWLEYDMFQEDVNEDGVTQLGPEHSEERPQNSTPIHLKLDDKGRASYITASLLSDLPIAQLNISSEITADDGETQTQTQSILYLSREHYIGTRFMSPLANDGKPRENSQLEIIAVNKAGELLDQLNVKVAFYAQNPRLKKRMLLGECVVSQLPAICNLPDVEGEVVADITSGDQAYLSYRSTWRRLISPTDIKPIFSLTSDTRTAHSGDPLIINLSSQYDGIATFSIWSGTLKKVWRQAVIKGNNIINVASEISWQPSMTLRVALPLSRQQTQAQIELMIAATKGTQYLRNSDDLNQLRVLNHEIQILLTPSSAKPVVNLSLSEHTTLPSSQISVTIGADQDVETHLWLVNSALWNTSFAQVLSSDFDYSNSLYSEQAFQSNMDYHAINQSLLMPNLLAHLPLSADARMPVIATGQLENKQADSMMIAESGVSTARINMNITDFVQSKWLGQLALSANQMQSISIKLPQLIGRWKIVALSATQQHTQVTSQDVTTASDLEYFVDAPATIFVNDKASIAISQHNRSSQALTDTLTIWVNDKQVQQIEVNLAANSYHRRQLPLLALSIGSSAINITSRNMPDFATQHQIEVLAGQITTSATWLINDDTKPHKIAMPPMLSNDSIALSVIPSGQSIPNWSRLTAFDKAYPHQLWEQTLSRAVSVTHNPLTLKDWPQGFDQLQAEIIRLHKLSYKNGLYSYAPKSDGDKFLTAYTYLAHHWLTNTAIKLPLEMVNDVANIKLATYQMVFDTSTDPLAKSMALLALASHRDIDLAEAMAMRQQIGITMNEQSQQANVLQALALKQLNASPILYRDIVRQFTQQGYLDTNTSLFNENSYKCFAAMLYPASSSEYAAISNEVLSEQMHEGHFGSPFANAVCSHLFSQQPISPHNDAVSPPFVQQDKHLKYNYASSPHWATLHYQQSLASMAVKANGLYIQRLLWVQLNGVWVPVTAEQSLKIGDLVRVQIILRSPRARQHVVISDFIAGALEAIYPYQNHQLYTNALSNSRFNDNNIAISKGTVSWYTPHLPEGNSSFVYFARVRHAGEFNMAPAKAEALYRDDVEAQTEASSLHVKF